MGQRLNVEIHNNGKPLANCYYHYDAYTKTALRIIQDLIGIASTKGGVIDVKKAIEIFLEQGATIEKSQAQGMVEPSKEISRLNGLVGTTKRYMDITRLWQEMVAVIDVGTQTADINGLFFEVEPDEYDGDTEIKDLYIVLEDLENIDFENIPLIEDIMNLEGAFICEGAIQMGNDSKEG